MLISQEKTDVSPLFKLERNGTQISMTVASSAYGYEDPDLGYWVWDGEISAILGDQEYYFYQTYDRPLDAFLQNDLTPGVGMGGSYYINYGQYDVTFWVTIFDAAANFTGGGSADFVFGSAFDDVMSGGEDNDGFEGAGGDDVINGGAGGDLIDGGDGNDTASYDGAAAGVGVWLDDNRNNSGEAKGDRLISIENLTGSRHADSLSGSAGANIIRGGGGGDFIFGKAGDDRLDGGSGADALFGGTGNDVLSGGAGGDILNGEGGNDTASYANAKASVAASLLPRALLLGDAAGDVLKSVENLTGSRFDDRLAGNAGVNVIDAGAGDDVIRGNGGADFLTGGQGQDSFMFAAPDAADIILDYSAADDRMVLDDKGFAGLSRGKLAAEAFGLGPAATTAAQRILYDEATGELRFDGDGTGLSAAVVFAVLKPGQVINEGEFLVA